jgi:hypothetical protein
MKNVISWSPLDFSFFVPCVSKLYPFICGSSLLLLNESISIDMKIYKLVSSMNKIKEKTKLYKKVFDLYHAINDIDIINNHLISYRLLVISYYTLV